ncbi:Uncharacterized protein BM_BM13348, partial [Brugia malayi]
RLCSSRRISNCLLSYHIAEIYGRKKKKICCTSRFYSTFGLNRSSMSVTSRVRRILIHRSE